MTNKKVSLEEQNEEKKELKRILKKGKYKVYSILRHVSQSGMSRNIDFYTIINNRMYYLTPRIAEMLDYKMADQGMRVGGCGMDMGFHVVYSLSVHLYCPKKYDHDKAYKLQHDWI